MNKIANIIQKTSSKITFQVHDVEINKKILLTKKIKELTNDLFLASSHSDNCQLISPIKGRNIFEYSVHMAFTQNYPLLITPDIIWMVIAQSFNQYINNQSALRHKFIDRQNKVSLKVQEATHYNSRVIASKKMLKKT